MSFLFPRLWLAVQMKFSFKIGCHKVNKCHGLLNLDMLFRSSRSQKFFKRAIIKKFAIYKGKYLCWSLFLIKLQAWNPEGMQLY